MLEGARVVVVGGGSGMGLAVARAAAAQIGPEVSALMANPSVTGVTLDVDGLLIGTQPH